MTEQHGARFFNEGGEPSQYRHPGWPVASTYQQPVNVQWQPSTVPPGPAGAGAPPQRRANRSTRLAALVLGAVLLSSGSAAAGGYASTWLHPHGTTTTKTTVAATSTVGRESLVTSAAKALPAVVSINTGSALGSGVVIDTKGVILTNNHVVETSRGGSVEVTFSDGRTEQGSVAGTDPSNDLAVVRLSSASGLTALAFADSDAVRVGDSVLAVGSPLGLNGSVTAGIVSALNRDLSEDSSEPGAGSRGRSGTTGQSTTISGVIQTDAAINSGNSGGALVNTLGQLIGINTAIATTGEGSGNIGVGFAIPSNTAKQVAERILSRS